MGLINSILIDILFCLKIMNFEMNEVLFEMIIECVIDEVKVGNDVGVFLFLFKYVVIE